MANHEIMAPIPGVFYRRPEPSKPVYVEEGQMVQPGDTLCLIEVMKTFHEIKSDVAGMVTTFLIENEGTVMAGQPIAVIEVVD